MRLTALSSLHRDGHAAHRRRHFGAHLGTAELQNNAVAILQLDASGAGGDRATCTSHGIAASKGRPSVDPELMIRMLLVGYCYGIRHERRLCQEVALHLAYRWFCKLDLDDKVPHHSTFSVNRLGRFRESEILRHIFERVVAACMAAGLVKGEGFAVDASVMEANASRYHGKAPNELDGTDAQRQKRSVAGYLAGLEAEAQVQQGGDSDGGVLMGRRPQRPIASRRR